MGVGLAVTTNHVIGGLGFWARWYQCEFGEGDRDQKLSSITFLMIQSIRPNNETLIKIRTPKHIRTSWLINTLVCQEGDIPWFSREKTGNLHIRHPSRPHPMGLYFWLVLICIFYNKSVIIRITLSWVLWVILVNHWTQEDSESPWIYSQLVRSRGDLETLRFVASVWNHGSLVGHCVHKLWILTKVIGVRIALQFCKC